MKKLFLIRHAKSGSKDHAGSDHARPLNHRGEKEALLMAKVLKKMEIKPELILTSSALRARTTADIFASVLQYPAAEVFSDSDLYLANIHNFLKQANLIEDKIDCTFIFSHNPGISEFACFLTGEALTDMPTCGIYGIQLNVNRWREVKSGIGKTILFEYPKKYGDD